MENFPGLNPDFSSLAETPEDKPEKKKSKEKKSKSHKLQEQETKPEIKKDGVDDKPEKDSSVPLESLASDEKKLVAEEYITSRTGEVRDELHSTISDSVGESEAIANAAFLENLKSKITESDDYSGTEIDDVLNDTIINLGLEAEDTYEVSDDISDDDNSATSSSGSGTIPPNPPSPSTGGTAPPSGGNGTYHEAVNNNQYINPNTVSQQETTYERKPAGSHLLVGGLIGYMIGRRGGRIRTEKKLIPIQKKLESEVINLQEQIALREDRIRKIVREQQSKKPSTNESLINKLHEHRLKQENKMLTKEKLGKILVSSNIHEDISGKSANIESLKLSELLNIAESIHIESTNVRKLYESNRITRENLSRIIKAYIIGEKFDKYIGNDNLSFEINKVPGDNDKSNTVVLNDNISPYIKQASFYPDHTTVELSENSTNYSTDSMAQYKKESSHSKVVWITLAILFAAIAGMFILK